MRKFIKLILSVLGLTVILAVACSNPAFPRACIDAVEEAGAPQSVLLLMNNPTGDLNQAEKLIIRQFLNRSQLNDICEES